MAQIVQPPNSFGAALGAGFSSGLTELLQNLATQKAQEIQSRRTTQALINAGVNPQLAQLYNVLSPDERKNFIQNLDISLPQQAQIQEQQPLQPQQAFDQLLNEQLRPQQVEYGLPQTSVSQLEQMLKPQNVAQAAPMLRLNEMLGQMPGELPMTQQMQEIVARGLEPRIQQTVKPDIQKQLQPPAPVMQQPVQQLATKQTIRPFENPQARRQQELLELKRNKIISDQQFREDKQINEENKPIDTIIDNDLIAVERIKPYVQQLRELWNTGKLAENVKGAITPLAMLNTESQQFQQAGDNIITAMSSTLKGQPTNFKVKLLERSKPNLGTSRQAQEVAIRNLEKMISDAQTRAQLRAKLKAENNNRPVKSLNFEISRKMKELGSAIDLEDGTIALNNKTGQPEYIVVDGAWSPI